MSGFFMAAGAAAKVEVPIDGSTGVWIKQGATVISSAMKMRGAVISSGYVQYVYSRGIAQSSLVSGTAQNSAILLISAGGVASDTVVDAGHVDVRGGTAHGIIVRNDMYAAVYQGYASGVIVSRGYLDVNDSTFVENIVLSRVAGGSGRCYVKSGGTASGIVVNSGTRLGVSAGGTALAVVSHAGGSVTSQAGAYIEYVTP